MTDDFTIGFYAPMKSPHHAVASGDREVARSFLSALSAAGFAPSLVSRLRCYLGAQGDRALAAKMSAADAEFERLRILWETDISWRPRLLFLYHVYHKSPDLLLYRLSRYFSLPLVIAEASYAPRRAKGLYERASALSREAIVGADLLLTMNPRDETEIKALCKRCDFRGDIVSMVPFADLSLWGSEVIDEGRDGAARDCVFIVHAMMRYGDKLRSYEVLAAAFESLSHYEGWRLVIIGGGAAESEVRALFARFGARVCFTGVLSRGEIAAWLLSGDIYVWPAVGEAYGMGLLEAVASGLAVIAGRRAGVSTIVTDGYGGILCAEGDRDSFARALVRLLEDYRDGGKFLRRAGDYNRRKRAVHDIAAAASVLRRHLLPLFV